MVFTLNFATRHIAEILLGQLFSLRPAICQLAKLLRQPAELLFQAVKQVCQSGDAAIQSGVFHWQSRSRPAQRCHRRHRQTVNYLG